MVFYVFGRSLGFTDGNKTYNINSCVHSVSVLKYTNCRPTPLPMS